jgi:LuxR family transcriptional regulator, maltose regulon positive regulatory protein
MTPDPETPAPQRSTAPAQSGEAAVSAADTPIPYRAAGLKALTRGDWKEAADAFTAAVATDPTDAAAWEGMAIAALWLEDHPRVIEARERGHVLYREAGDDRGAARMALELAGAHLELRGEMAVANGWFQRARRILSDLPPGPEHALLHIWDAFFAIEGELDPDAAIEHAARAVEIAEACDAPDLAMLARALEGMSRVIRGEVSPGMALLDEAVASAVAGESSDPDIICRTCCCMIDACEQVRDWGRAVEWCDRLRELSERWRVHSFLATCRVKHSGVLLWRGEWEAAETELTRARDHFAATRPPSAAAPIVRLAEVRRRQGRREAAEALLEEVGTHPAAVPVRAAIAIDAGNADLATELLSGALRRIPERACTERIYLYELLVRAELARERTDRAGEALAHLEALAEEIGTDPMRAAALAACGAVALASKDPERACDCFEEAAHLCERSGSPYECARSRVELARALHALGSRERAASEAAAALAILDPMGAVQDADAARELAGGEMPGQSALTPRQREVLALAAEGLTDREMGERLFISEYTVHRHMSDIFTRLRVSTRTGAVAKALREGLV